MKSATDHRSLLGQIETLPPLPIIVERILAVTDSPNSSASDVARVLCEDQTVAAKVLRVANSPLYGSARRVTQISRAVVMLGSVAVRNLVVGVCAHDALAACGAGNAEHERLWGHSIATAAACDVLARRIRYEPPEEAFVAGLLHDIGQLAMLVLQPQPFRRMLQNLPPGACILEAEREVFGVDHALVGVRVLENWRLPEAFGEAARWHHSDTLPRGDRHTPLFATVMLADALSTVLGIELGALGCVSNRIGLTTDILKLPHRELGGILRQIDRVLTGTAEVFSTSLGRYAATTSADRGRVLWVSAHAPAPTEIRWYLLERRGYEPHYVNTEDLARQFKAGDLIVLDVAGHGQDALAMARALTGTGARGVVILDPDTDGHDPQHLKDLGAVFQIPRTFTARDLHWCEAHL